MINTDGKFILNFIYLDNQSDSHEYLMQRSSISGKFENIKYIDAGGSKSTRALTRDQQYIYIFALDSVNFG